MSLVTIAELVAGAPALAGRADVQALLDAASEYVELRAGRSFSRSQGAESLDGTGTPVLQLSRWPVHTLTSVVENGITLTLNTDFSHDATNGRLVRRGPTIDPYGSCWPRGTGNIVVTYDGGPTTVPTVVKQATILVARSLATRLDVGSLLEEQTPEYRYKLSDDPDKDPCLRAANHLLNLHAK